MEMPKTNATAFQTLKDNWFLIVFFMGMAVTWGSFSQKDKVQEARIEILEVKAEKNDDGIQRVNENLVELNTSMKYIQTSLDKLTE
jgi:hypothetical protein